MEIIEIKAKHLQNSRDFDSSRECALALAADDYLGFKTHVGIANIYKANGDQDFVGSIIVPYRAFDYENDMKLAKDANPEKVISTREFIRA